MEVTSIYTEFRQSLLSFIRSKVQGREDAEDILQNVFVKIAANLDGLTEREKLRSWIYSITRNSIIDYYRSKANKKHFTLEDDLEQSIPETESFDSTKGLDQCMGKMIALLPEQYRNVIIDSEINGMQQKVLAAKYGMPYSSMRSRVQRGRERLKQLFYNCCHIATDARGNILDVAGRANGCSGCDPC